MSAIRRPRKLAVFISFSGTGGVERMVLNLLPEFVERALHAQHTAIENSAATGPVPVSNERAMALWKTPKENSAPNVTKLAAQATPAMSHARRPSSTAVRGTARVTRSR